MKKPLANGTSIGSGIPVAKRVTGGDLDKALAKQGAMISQKINDGGDSPVEDMDSLAGASRRQMLMKPAPPADPERKKKKLPVNKGGVLARGDGAQNGGDEQEKMLAEAAGVRRARHPIKRGV